MNKSIKRDMGLLAAGILIILLLLINTICGIASFDTTQAYEIVNQYGNTVKMWGSGIYAHDSYFMAPIFIGSDLTILLFIVPLAVVTLFKTHKQPCIEQYISSLSVMGLLLYYTAGLAFGVTYNALHLVYIALFGLCFYCVGALFVKLHAISVRQENVCTYPFTGGMKAFLIISGVSLFVAWLPDIVTSLINGTSLETIEVYTTSITYVLDIGIISPMIFITFWLMKRNSFMGYALMRILLQLCSCIGIMLPIQTAFQIMAGISVPIPALITKVLIFVMLAAFATFFQHRLKCGVYYVDSEKEVVL